MRKLAVAQSIQVSQRSRSESELLLEAVRKHFRQELSQKKDRLATFAFPIAKCSSELPAPSAADAEQCITAADVIDLATLKRYRSQYEDLPTKVEKQSSPWKEALHWACKACEPLRKTWAPPCSMRCNIPGGYKAVRSRRQRRLPVHLRRSMLTAACIQKVRSWGATAPSDATRPSSASRTPSTLPALANILRDPERRLRCPFGDNWEDESGGCSRLGNINRIPFWLALTELHGDGRRYGAQSERQLPHVFDRLLGCLTQGRTTRQLASRGSPEHLISVPEDLEKAPLANPIFRGEIAAH